jgi:hypothetical protein
MSGCGQLYSETLLRLARSAAAAQDAGGRELGLAVLRMAEDLNSVRNAHQADVHALEVARDRILDLEARLLQAGFERVARAVAGRSYSEVNADLEVQAADSFDDPDNDTADTQVITDPDAPVPVLRWHVATTGEETADV